MIRLLNILLCLSLFNALFAQRDEVLKDTLVNGKHFNVIMYDDSDHVACIGNYSPNSFIRSGEWDYFFPNGKLYAEAFFKLDDKTGIWFYYNQQGNVAKQIKPCKKRHSFIDYYCNPADDDAIMDLYYRRAQQNPHACVLFSNGSAPLEYDEKMYQFKVNLMVHNMAYIQGDNTYYYKEVHRKKNHQPHHHHIKKYQRY